MSYKTFKGLSPEIQAIILRTDRNLVSQGKKPYWLKSSARRFKHLRPSPLSLYVRSMRDDVVSYS